MMLKGVYAAFFILILCLGDICSGDDDTTGRYCNGFNSNASNANDYQLHRALKEGLANNSKSLYNIQKAKLKHKSDSKIACLSVMFKIQCISQDESECFLDDTNSENVNGANIVFLWSSFDTSSYLGSFLLNYTAYDLRVFGFGWEDDCELYQLPINIFISVNKIPSVTEDEFCSALQYITTLLPAYSIAQNISTQTEEVGIGYARPWHVSSQDQTWRTDPIVMLITISILVLSKLTIITLVITYNNDARELMRGKNSPFYYFFWGCHCTTLLALIIGNTIHTVLTQENKLIIVITFIISGLIDLIGAAFVVLIMNGCLGKELLPVPLTACFKLCEKLKYCSKLWEYALNIASFFFTFYFISSILQMVPNILISYYAFPSRTLIHIGFFQVGFVCSVFAFGGITYLIEKCSWLIHIKVHKKIPEELDSTALIFNYINVQESQSQASTDTLPPNPSNTLNPTGGASIAGSAPVETNQPSETRQGSAPVKSSEPYAEIVYSRTAELKHSKCLWIAFLQILTAFLGVVALMGLIVVIGIIVFTDTVEKDDLQGILTLLPTIAVDAAIILTRKRFFDNNLALKYRLARVVEVMVNQSPSEDTPLLH